MKNMALDQMESVARQRTQNELKNYVIPEDIKKDIALTTLFEGDDRVFVLYAPGKSRDNPREIAKTRVNSVSGDVFVEVMGLERK